MNHLSLKILTILVFLFNGKIGIAQNDLVDTIQFEIFDDSEPLPGVTARKKFGNQNYDAITDLKGKASLIVPKKI
jgi:hypothetical protein